jgi:AcrR family transcriptional regulator
VSVPAPTRLDAAPPRRRSVPRAAALRTVQPRAAATRDALLAAARRLLADRDFDELSIADIASSAGLSVGSFYGRFRDKATFFGVLQQQVTAEWLARGVRLLTGEGAARRGSREWVEVICGDYLAVMREDRGFVRASLRHEPVRGNRWAPIRQVGAQYVDAVIEVLGPRLTHLDPMQRAPRIRFAMQVVFGAGFNAVLNDPGPMRLDDPGFGPELARVMSAYLEIGD